MRRRLRLLLQCLPAGARLKYDGELYCAGYRVRSHLQAGSRNFGSDGPFAVALCNLCAAICHTCNDECAQHS